MMTLFLFIAILSLLVFVHELGHFIAARRSGVCVEEFGFGFPPRIIGFRGKKSDTLYSLNWIPVGGFVKLKGENGDDAKDRDSFAMKSARSRSVILVAGVLMNILLAWILLSIGSAIGLPRILENVPSYANVTDEKVYVTSVLPHTPAESAGIRSGDILISIDGEKVKNAHGVGESLEAQKGIPVRLRILREDAYQEFLITPETITVTGKAGIGVGLIATGFVSVPWYFAPVDGFLTTFGFLEEIILAFFEIIRNLVFGKAVGVDLSGPIGIAFITSEVAALGIRHLLQFTALLSLNLAVINILPFPALDGGRLLFLVIERLRGKPVGRVTEATLHHIGFFCLMLLVIVVTYRDVVKFGDRIVDGAKGIFGF